MFIEIETGQIGKDKNVIIGVIYRLPDTEIKIFHEYVSELIDKIRPVLCVLAIMIYPY